MDYLKYAQLLWAYLPYMIYAFVFLTLLPKSFRRIIKFAARDYEANRFKYHRCYGPDLCCHPPIDEDEASKPAKQRKAVTRIYPKRQKAPAPPKVAIDDDSNEPQIKRQVQPSQIEIQVHVNQIAKMFESGGMANRKINRVMPTAVQSEKHAAASDQLNIIKLNDESSDLLHENIENSPNLLNGQHSNNNNWSHEPMSVTRRHKRAVVPATLSYAGTSATPSTASPAASASPVSSSPPLHSRSPTPTSPTSPVQLRTTKLNLQTSVEDIFAALARTAERNSDQNESYLYVGCNSLSPVTSIDDILSQRRLSRPLSAYSISDLLMNEENSRIDEFYENSLHRSLNESEA